jgi:poly(A) polymerase
MHAAEAQRRAADRVTLHQLQMLALPRRFSLPMQEIWLLQARFSQRRRVGRLLAHPRFRAAYDFLVLRQAASPEHAEEARFWREAQHAAGTDGAHAGVDGDSGADAADDELDLAQEGAPPRRRRRRRRSGGTGGGQPGAA